MTKHRATRCDRLGHVWRASIQRGQGGQECARWGCDARRDDPAVLEPAVEPQSK